MYENKKWIITTSGDRSLEEVRKDLVSAGLRVDQVLDQIGCITGEASVAVAQRLLNIPGVVDVSPDEAIDIGLPGSDETW
jgi:hypothetical protein